MAVDERSALSDSSTNQPDSARLSDADIDIGSFMDHYVQVSNQFHLLSRLLIEINKIRRWENYCLSLTVSVSFSLLLLFPRALIAGVCGICFILVLAGNHYIIDSFLSSKRRKQQITVPKPINEDSDKLESCFREERNRKKSLVKYRHIVKSADSVLIEVGSFFDMIRSIYMWDDSRISINVCFFLLVVSLSMLWFTVSTLFSLLVLILFCWNQEFIKKTKSMFLRVFSKQKSKTFPSHSSTSNATSHGSPPDDFNSQNSLLASIENSDSGSISVGMNEKANKKDKGSCSRCGASFTSLLKRKHPCNNCGHIFCGSCTVKVPRASLGATSPAAFQQTVRVCLTCKEELSIKSEENAR